MRVVVMMIFMVVIHVGCVRGDKASPQSSQELIDRIVNSEQPVAVNFWARWCMACIALDPTLEELSREYAGKVQFVTVDVDLHREISQYFRIDAIPAVFIIEDKTVRIAINGMRDKDTYRNALNDVLKLAESRR
ncbi:MAG: hypothetical protein LBC70_10720 [Chitinispirillales bacterium]|nr:hypothetical protein [Chitinispirillales bacterium]